MESYPGDRYSGAARGGPGLQCIKSVLMGASHHLQMSHCPPVRSRLTQVRFLPAVVRFRLHDEPGWGPLRQWGQEDTWREESQEEERLRQVERRFAMSEPGENFGEMGHLRHLGH